MSLSGARPASKGQNHETTPGVPNRYREHIEAGDLYYLRLAYPCIEWYSQNGGVVLELDRSHVEMVDVDSPKAKTPAELVEDEEKRTKAFGLHGGDGGEFFPKEPQE